MKRVLITGITRDSKGKFTRTTTKWSPHNSESGYIDNNGRFRVYFPEHSRSYSDGYVLRSIVHYEYYNAILIPEGYDIHHLDGNKLNDSKENLIMLSHSDHAKLHNPKVDVNLVCEQCNKSF